MDSDHFEERHFRAGAAWLLIVELSDTQVDVEDGPVDEWARRHEGGGGRQSVDDFLARPAGWTAEFPGLAARVRERIKLRRSGVAEAWRDVVPMLKHPSWPGAAHSLCRKLIPSYAGEQPLVAWALKRAPLVTYVGELKHGAGREQLEEQALKNVRASYVTTRHSRQVSPEGFALDLLLVEGEFAAERALDLEALASMRRELDTLALTVAIPRRGLLVAMPHAAKAADAFGRMARVFSEQAGEELRLPPLVYLYANGELRVHAQR